MDNESKRGIATLSRRLSKLEKNNNTNNEEDSSDSENDQLSKLLVNLRKKQKQRKKEKMKEILSHFENDITKSILLLNPDNIVEILIFVLKYTEANCGMLATHLELEIDSNLKKSLAISFIEHLFKNTYSVPMLELSINTLSKILFPKVIAPKVEDTLPPEKKKKGFFK
jgi:hypothetical protein